MLLKAKSSKSRPRCRFANFPPKTMRAWLVYKKSRMRKYWEMWGQRRLAGNEIKRKKKKKNTDNSVDANSICWKAGGALREWYSFGTDLTICCQCIVGIIRGTQIRKLNKLLLELALLVTVYGCMFIPRERKTLLKNSPVTTSILIIFPISEFFFLLFLCFFWTFFFTPPRFRLICRLI